MEDTLFIIVCLNFVFTTVLYAHVRLLNYDVEKIKNDIKYKR